MAEDGAGAGAEIMDKGGAGAGFGAENNEFWLRNTALFLSFFKLPKIMPQIQKLNSSSSIADLDL